MYLILKHWQKITLPLIQNSQEKARSNDQALVVIQLYQFEHFTSS